MSDGMFPPVTASSLAGRRYALPGDFEGEVNLALVAFQRWHQDWVDTWLPLAQELAAAYPDFRFYELPTIRAMNRLYRWSIDAGMRAGIADKQAHAVTITLYLDKEPFRQALQLPSEATIYALLVNRAGQVLWRGEGALTEEQAQGLSEAVRRRLTDEAAPDDRV